MMSGLIPFNRRGSALNFGNDGFYEMLDDFFSSDFNPMRTLAKDTFKIDVSEEEAGYKIHAELPGVSKEEINLDFMEGKLTISVERNEATNEDNKNYIHRERRYSSMSRSIYLKEGAPEGVTAKLENGVLEIDVPKKEKISTGTRIEIV